MRHPRPLAPPHAKHETPTRTSWPHSTTRACRPSPSASEEILIAHARTPGAYQARTKQTARKSYGKKRMQPSTRASPVTVEESESESDSDGKEHAPSEAEAPPPASPRPASAGEPGSEASKGPAHSAISFVLSPPKKGGRGRVTAPTDSESEDSSDQVANSSEDDAEGESENSEPPSEEGSSGNEATTSDDSSDEDVPKVRRPTARTHALHCNRSRT